VGIVIAFLVVLLGLVGCGEEAAVEPRPLSEAVDAREVDAGGLREHLFALAEIADENGGTRAAGTPGYAASVDYVRETLEGAGYEVRVQEFPFRTFAALVEARVVAPERRELPATALQYSGETPDGGVRGAVTAAGDGCDGADFAGGVEGRVALVERGSCPFFMKVQNAQDANAVAVLIYNDQPGSIAGTLGRPGLATIPALGLRKETGEQLARQLDMVQTVVDLSVETEERDSTSENVIAEASGDREGPVIVAGAHLDSVPVGPGINDNGSGVATLLEIAEQGPKVWAEGAAPNVRFAFWGAEEAGLVGSRHYVNQLDADEADEIALYFNLDMVGSPNFERLVYRGDPETRGVQRLLGRYFRDRNLASSTVEMGRSSDHVPFEDRGIPVSGLFTGAGETAPDGKPYDSCYHERCDDLDNVDVGVLREMANATAYALASVASNPSLVE
jgi:Zn-dependent M28 family amino/carboxypeptidase